MVLSLPTDNECDYMDKILRFYLLTLLVIILVYIPLTIVYNNVVDFSWTFNINYRLSAKVFMVATAGVAWLLSLKTYKRYRSQKTLVGEILVFYLLLSGFASAIQSLQLFFIPSNPEIITMWQKVPFFLVFFSITFILYFIIEVFYTDVNHTPNKTTLIYFHLIGACFISASVFLMMDAVNLTTATGEYIVGGIALVVTIPIYIMLVRQAFGNAKRVGDTAIKRGFHCIGINGIFLIAAFVLTFLYQLKHDEYLILLPSFICYMISFIFLYIGFTSPQRGKTQLPQTRGDVPNLPA